jgi:hypothetical protein
MTVQGCYFLPLQQWRETITELTEGTEGDNQLEKQRRKRRDLPCLCPLWVIQFLQNLQ